MLNKNLWSRAMAVLLAAALFSSCAASPESGEQALPKAGASGSAPASDGTAAPSEAAVSAQYETITLTSEGLPVEAGAAYYLPLGEGKYIPADDTTWREYLSGQELSALESFSMPFVAADCGEYALVYVMENPYRASVRFTSEPDIRLTLVGEESALDSSSENTARVYTTENNAASVAGAYSDYIRETRDILTLAEKEAQNPNIQKLYGAPHIYLWGEFSLSEEDVRWPAFLKSTQSPVFSHISRLLATTEEDEGQFSQVLLALSGQDYVDKYQRGVLLRGLSTALAHPSFYDSAVFTNENAAMKALLAKGERNPAEQAELSRQTLFESLPGVFAPVSQWYDHDSTDIINELKSEGIDAAWIGLNAWEQAYRKPQLVEAAVQNGYLIGPYDSYHSIHEPGSEKWETAAFPDTTLYENATVQNEAGEKIGGFQNVGRKLNPTLALPSVKQRVSDILATGAQFNSWFVDCDATGEVYDDYSPAHPTTKQQDVAARLERMDYISQEHGMIVGSEGGNDFAANSIAFGHGIELQSFSWMDEDMKANKDSEYYLGRYYSPSGGVPEKFAKPVPVKEKYRQLFLDMSYQAPLFGLVYNDSVITSYHWDWSTTKITGETENRMLREILYNTPPMYHLDRAEWDGLREQIASHNAVWSEFSKKAISQKMTDFSYLTADRLVQKTSYGSALQAVANFSDSEYQHEGTAIPKRSVLIIDGGDKQVYTP